LGRERGKGEWREDVVIELGGHQRIEAGPLHRRGEGPDLAPMPHRQHRKNAHLSFLRTVS